MINIREMDGGIVVSVKVQPNSSKDRIVGEHADQIKIAVTVPPEKGKANKAVIKVLAKWDCTLKCILSLVVKSASFVR